LVCAPGLQIDDIIAIYQSEPVISEVGFLVNDDKVSIELASAFLFTAQTCHENIIKTINRFSRDTGLWENSNFYPNKYQNFYGCSIEVLHDNRFSNAVTKKIFEELAATLNFKLVRRYVERIFISYEYSHDYQRQMAETFAPQTIGSRSTFRSSAVFFDLATFVVPPGEPLTELEKMFAAFDRETWIAIGATFIIAMVVIRVVSYMSIQIQNVVFGRGGSPSLNVVSIFLNGGQHRVPGTNFGRYLLMLFILWSLIFRTCYQSIMFQNLTRDMRHPQVKSLEELKEKNFKLIHDHPDRYEWLDYFAER
jgi:hypothetical protein